jgi:hypothetical protein
MFSKKTDDEKAAAKALLDLRLAVSGVGGIMIRKDPLRFTAPGQMDVPVAGAKLTVDRGEAAKRITATRVALAGPFGHAHRVPRQEGGCGPQAGPARPCQVPHPRKLTPRGDRTDPPVSTPHPYTRPTHPGRSRPREVPGMTPRLLHTACRPGWHTRGCCGHGRCPRQ